MASPTLADATSRTRSVGKKWINAKNGMRVVPGRGDGTKDTVHAMLAPHEAVLNKAAAEKLGRSKIAKLNVDGAKKMGLRSIYKKEKKYSTGTQDIESDAEVQKDQTSRAVAVGKGNPADAMVKKIKHDLEDEDKGRTDRAPAPPSMPSSADGSQERFIDAIHKRMEHSDSLTKPSKYVKGTSDVKRGLRSVYKSRKG